MSLRQCEARSDEAIQSQVSKLGLLRLRLAMTTIAARLRVQLK
jgi:hypothetical protein